MNLLAAGLIAFVFVVLLGAVVVWAVLTVSQWAERRPEAAAREEGE